MTLLNSIVSGNQWYGCELGAFGAGVVTITSWGHNVVQDTSCGAVASDSLAADPLLGPLAANGGPTWTHLPLPGSPALDRAPTCPATDQRGVSRPQGSACDAGSVEREP